MDCEKENINVVIVPENILQAIRNSSSLNVDVADTSNVVNIQPREDYTSIQDGINLSTFSNSNLWFMFSGENLELNSTSTVLDENMQDDTCLTSVVEVVDGSSNSAVRKSTANETSNTDSSNVVLYQNCSFQQQTNCDDLAFNKEVSPLSFIQTHNTSNAPVSVEQLDNACKNNTYSLSASSVDENFLKINLSSFHSSTGTSTARKICTANTTNAAYVSDTTTVVNPPIISHQEVVKNSVSTADKGTYTYGISKTLHQCDVENCNQVFKSALECRKHKTTVHGKAKSYKCKYANCLWSFSTPYKLRRHLESHYKRKPYACTYPGCNAVFSSDYNLAAHAKHHYTINPSRICKVCSEVCDNKRKLTAHMRDVHNEIPDFVCNICKRNLRTLAALVIHKRSHNSPLEYTCPVCEKKFTKRYYLKIHLYTHTGEKPFKCDECSWSFASLSRLNRHKLIHKENQRFMCTEEGCEKKFYRLNHLLQHMRKAHKAEPCSESNVLQMYMSKGDEEVSFYQCDACGLRCLTTHGLERHKLKCKIRIKDISDQKMPVVEEVVVGTDSSNDDAVDIDNNSQIGQDENIIVEINDFVDEDLTENDAPTRQEILPSVEDSLLNNHPIEVAGSSPASRSPDLVLSLKKSWNPSLVMQTSLPDNLQSSQYLPCSTDGSSTPVDVVPFIDDMDVLNDPTTHRFLQLDEELSVCVDPRPVASASTDPTDENDVLKQYVVSRDVLNAPVPDEVDSTSSLKRNSRHLGVSPSLFADDVSLTSVGNEASRCCQFPGSTININDIH